MKKQVDDPGGPGSPAARKKQKTLPSPVEKEEKKKQRGRPYVDRGNKVDSTTGWW